MASSNYGRYRNVICVLQAGLRAWLALETWAAWISLAPVKSAMARRLGVDPSTILLWKTGRRRPSKKLLRIVETDVAMAMDLCRTLGGHKLTDVVKGLGLEKYSSVSAACLSMKRRIETEKRPASRGRSVEKLLKSRQQT